MGLAGIELATPATREKKKKDLKGNAGGGDRTHNPRSQQKKRRDVRRGDRTHDLRAEEG